MRLQIAAFFRCFCLVFLILSGIVGAALVASWFYGNVHSQFVALSVIGIPVAAGCIAFGFHRRPTTIEAARHIDRHTGTKDLFLTVALLEKSAGEYQPLVAKSAETKAAKILPAAVLPYQWTLGVGLRTAAATVLFAGVIGLHMLPKFVYDVAAAEQDQRRHEKLAETKKATELRAKEIKSDAEEREESPEVKQATEGLANALKQMKPQFKVQNAIELGKQQKHLGEMWRKISAEKLKDLLAKSPQEQDFGLASKSNLQKWAKELQDGSTESLRKQLDELKEEIQQLQKTSDPIKKQELEQKLKKKMKELQEFAQEKANSKPLAAALERAMKQIEMAKMEGLNTESLDAAMQSMDLAKMELKEIAQSAKDLKALEEALKVVQMAKRLNEKEKLDGESGEGPLTLADYEELYAQLMEGMDGDGEGLGGEGQGSGGKAPEDDAAVTGFKTEQSKSSLVAGKVLLSLKTKGLGEGEKDPNAGKNYGTLVQQVKQGVDEAILQEQIPPGYRDGIKKYFDTLDKEKIDAKK